MTDRENGETIALDRFVAAFPSRDAMASAYADYLIAYGTEWPAWPALNLAVIDRWSVSGLRYIKEKAWGIAAPSPEETHGGRVRPWVCPKCGRVYGPIVMVCAPCNAKIDKASAVSYPRTPTVGGYPRRRRGE